MLMNKIRSLDVIQKIILVSMIVMTLGFAVVYAVTMRRIGFEYMDTIFVPVQEDDSTVYAAKLQGKQAVFTVSADKTVVFQCDGKTYGPYTAVEDPTAISGAGDDGLTGVELRCGDRVVFRGGIDLNESYYLFESDGSLSTEMWVWADNAEVTEPTPDAILELIYGPELKHHGEWLVWLGGVLICILNALNIFFIDKIFRWDLSFRIAHADSAEPSEWEIVGRYIGWIGIAVLAAYIYYIGLQ